LPRISSALSGGEARIPAAARGFDACREDRRARK
jgi:hypothetical protein